MIDETGAQAAETGDDDQGAAYWRARAERAEHAYRHIRLAVLCALPDDDADSV